MKFTQEHYKYFEGSEFSTGYAFKLEDNPLRGRTQTILDIVRGKAVMHVGCCDHVGVHKGKNRRKHMASWAFGTGVRKGCRDRHK